jgi:hypothetical protein
MTLLDRVVRALLARHVPHAMIGAAALAARGIARSTYDIDLLTTDVRVLEPDTWRPLELERVAVDIRRGDAEDPLGGVVRVEAPGERPVDVILGKHAWQARAIERADRPAGGPPVVTARDLVMLKLYAGGTQDLWDVRQLVDAPGGEQLIADVESELPAHSTAMRDRWADARR